MNSTIKWPSWFVLTRHWLSLVGVALVTTAVISWLFVLPLRIRGHVDNPYVGIVIFLILPALFFTGLVLIPIGIYARKRQIRKGLEEPAFDRQAALRRLAWFFGLTTVVNVLIGTQFTYRAVKHMETPQFCGQSCHSMNPEFAAYSNSPHAKVECVDCHVAPGASGWIASKTSGIRQLVETVLKTYPRPIRSALETNRLVPARQTCENCHWPQKFGSVKLRVFTHYAEDEQNTRTQTVLLMIVGGSKFAGIHGKHFAPGISIRLAADSKRQTIPWVEYRNTTTGKVEVFVSEGVAPDSIKALPIYEMQCVELLTATYQSSEEAADKLPSTLVSFYQQGYPDLYAKRSQDIQHAAQAVLAIYKRNVFPDLKVTWGTYPNNLGHTEFPGCFRCHDGSHVTRAGDSITQDCNVCHEPLAMDEASPEILRTLGVEERISKLQKK